MKIYVTTEINWPVMRLSLVTPLQYL